MKRTPSDKHRGRAITNRGRMDKEDLFGDPASSPKAESTLGMDAKKSSKERIRDLPGRRMLVPRVYYREKTCVCGKRLRTYASATEPFYEAEDTPWLEMDTIKNAGSGAATAVIHTCRAKPT